MKIISADERLAEARGVKALIIGPTGVGKTSLLRTLLSETTLFIQSASMIGRVHAIWHVGSADLTRHSRQRPVTARRIIMPSVVRLKISIDIKQFLSTASPLSAGFHFDGLSSNRRLSASARARRTRAAHTGCMAAK